MRIAFVAAGGFDPSGRERIIPSLVELTKRLGSRHQVSVFVLRYFHEPRDYDLHGVHIRDLGRPGGLVRQTAALMRAMASENPFDILHAYWALPSGVAATWASALQRPVYGRRRIPAVVTLDSGEFVSMPAIAYGIHNRPKWHATVGTVCRWAARTTVCTEFQAALARRFGITPEIVPLGIDTDVFSPDSGRSCGPPWRLIHVASLNRVKDQPLLLQSMRALRNKGVNAHLDIVGEDTLDGDVHRLAASQGLADDVTFHGFKSSEDLVPFYQRAHLAVLTSYHEAAGVVALEAAACGVPTVGTNVGYVSDWHGTRSIAVPVREPAAIADAIAGALADRPTRIRLGAAARDWAVTHNADWTAHRFEELYRELVGQ